MDAILCNKTNLLADIETCQRAIETFRQKVREYYFEVLLGLYRCPVCDSRFTLVEGGQADCPCGWQGDPTIEFQNSDCCRTKLIRKRLHYICSRCHKITPSIFLFDERLFDRNYFIEKMRRLREKGRIERFENSLLLLSNRSDVLSLTEEINFDSIPGLIEDLDGIIGINQGNPDFLINREEPTFSRYKQYVLSLLHGEILFSSISPIGPDSRLDTVYRFISLIFMENEQEVILIQYGNDILVKPR